jgi:hypothetical protein
MERFDDTGELAASTGGVAHRQEHPGSTPFGAGMFDGHATLFKERRRFAIDPERFAVQIERLVGPGRHDLTVMHFERGIDSSSSSPVSARIRNAST